MRKQTFAARVSCIIGMLFLSAYALGQTPQTPPASYGTIPVNYVRSWDAAKPETDINNITTAATPQEFRMITKYTDGLGRGLQTVVKQGSMVTGSSAVDMVNASVYDEFGRSQFQYLPFASSGSNGLFKSDPFQQQATFSTAQYAGEQFYYGQTQFEASPLNRPTKTLAPGDSWVGAGRGQSQKYWVNTTTDDVKIWTVTNSGTIGSFGLYTTTSSYPAGELHKTVSEDEHQKQVIEFTDKEGKLVLKKVQLTATADDGTGKDYSGWLCTYYIYDDYNRVRAVIQPKGVEQLAVASWQFTTNILNELTFRYEYDAKGRMIVKKAPGSQESYAVYDLSDRLVMMQDAKLRAQSKWYVVLYDELSRPIITGLADNSSMGSKTFATHLADASTSSAYPFSVAPATGWELLTESHYDDYTNLPSGLTSSLNASGYTSYLTAASSAPDYADPVAASSAVRGGATWTRVKVLGENTYISTVLIYDVKGRVIQTQSLNYTGGLDITTNQYSFSGQLLGSHTKHQKSGTNPQTHTVATKNHFDALGRPTYVEKSVNGSGWKTISTLEYDALGQVKTKKIGTNPSTSAPLETLAYNYTIRGWLQGINKGYLSGTSTASYFGMELDYDKDGYASNGSKQYNGNIGAAIWRSQGDGEKRKYEYGYDATSRMLKADFTQLEGSTWTNSTVNFNVKMGDGADPTLAYDANGNIKRMQQWGLKISGSSQIDDLSYTYLNSGNQLQAVTDAVNDNQSKLGDFKYDATSKTSTDYSYDVNGNLTADNNKKISTLSYNFLNLPQTVTITSKGSIDYVYDAAGNKLKKVVHETGKADKTTLYLFGLYQDDQLQFLPQEEGRIRPLRDVNGAITSFTYDYFIKDHLSNVRMVLTEEQKTDGYEPLTFEDTNVTQQNAQWENRQGASINVAGVRTSVSMNTGQTYAMLVRKSTGSIGAAKLLKVMAGDRIHAKVDFYYNATSADNSNTNAVTNILNSLVNSITNSSAPSNLVHGSESTVSSQLSTNTDFSTAVNTAANTNPNNTAQQAPKAYLCVLFFNEQFQFDKNSSVVVPVGYSPNTRGTIDRTFSNAIKAQKNGYVYVYFTNESDELVYFDNFYLSHERGAIQEESHYYPFGLQMAAISSKAAGSMPNRYKFNGGTELEREEFSDGSGLDIYATDYRSYDAQLGRFHQIDPMAENYESWTPYMFSYNNPINFNDPLGLDPKPLPSIPKFAFAPNPIVNPDAPRGSIDNPIATNIDVFVMTSISGMGGKGGAGGTMSISGGYAPISQWSPVVIRASGNPNTRNGGGGYAAASIALAAGRSANPATVLYGAAALTAFGITYAILHPPSPVEPVSFAGSPDNTIIYRPPFILESKDKTDHLRGGGQNQRDADIKQYPKDFQRWYHKGYKKRGDPDASKEELKELYDDWINLGKPNVK